MHKYLIVILLLIRFAVDGQILSQWRGLDRSGVYPETGLLKVWPENGPEMKWMVKDLPKGNSSVAIVGDMFYLTGNRDSVDILVAIDKNQQIKWQTRYGKSFEAFPESRSIPTVEENRIYVSSGTGEVACIDAKEGNILCPNYS